MIVVRIRPMRMRISTFSLYLFFTRSSIHSAAPCSFFVEPTRGCFFLCGNIDPLYSYYYKRVTLLCSCSAACSPFAFPSSFRCLCAASQIGEHNNPENTTPSLSVSTVEKSRYIGFPGFPTPILK